MIKISTAIICTIIAFSSVAEEPDTDVNFKKHYNSGIASNPSYCIGYADAKIFQTGNQTYYKWMKQWYEDQVSSTDLIMKPFNNSAYIEGTEMNNNDLTVECVYEFDYILHEKEVK